MFGFMVPSPNWIFSGPPKVNLIFFGDGELERGVFFILILICPEECLLDTVLVDIFKADVLGTAETAPAFFAEWVFLLSALLAAFFSATAAGSSLPLDEALAIDF
jgi:hypothetical protein